jgi:hypothetical protein
MFFHGSTNMQMTMTPSTHDLHAMQAPTCFANYSRFVPIRMNHHHIQQGVPDWIAMQAPTCCAKFGRMDSPMMNHHTASGQSSYWSNFYGSRDNINHGYYHQHIQQNPGYCRTSCKIPYPHVCADEFYSAM